MRTHLLPRPLLFGFAATTLLAPAVRAAVVFSTDFELPGVPPEFVLPANVNEESTANWNALGFGRVFLRNANGGNPAAATQLVLTGLPPHTHVDLSFALAVIDSWDGDAGPDIFNVAVDGATVFSRTFDNLDAGNQSFAGAPLSFGVNLGFNPAYHDAAYSLTGLPELSSLPHTADSLTISWFASGSGWNPGFNAFEESWAIDNVTVSVSAVPEASGWAWVTGLGLVALVVARLRQRGV